MDRLLAPLAEQPEVELLLPLLGDRPQAGVIHFERGKRRRLQEKIDREEYFNGSCPLLRVRLKVSSIQAFYSR